MCSCDHKKRGKLHKEIKEENKRRKEGGDLWCVTAEEALNNSHDIDLATLLPSSLPRPLERKPTCRLLLSPPLTRDRAQTQHRWTHVIKRRDRETAISLMTSDKYGDYSDRRT